MSSGMNVSSSPILPAERQDTAAMLRARVQRSGAPEYLQPIRYQSCGSSIAVDHDPLRFCRSGILCRGNGCGLLNQHPISRANRWNLSAGFGRPAFSIRMGSHSRLRRTAVPPSIFGGGLRWRSQLGRSQSHSIPSGSETIAAEPNRAATAKRLVHGNDRGRLCQEPPAWFSFNHSGQRSGEHAQVYQLGRSSRICSGPAP